MKKSKQILNVITGVAFIAFMVFASGFDRATTANYVGMAVCGLWLLFAGWRGVKHGNNFKK